MATKGLHDGHKQRLRDKFAANDDCSSLSDHEVLELLLNYANIRKNTNNTAHLLIEKFGSIDRVLDASREELCEVEGVGDSMATLILLQRCVLRLYEQRKHDIIGKTINNEDFIPYVRSLFIGARDEMAYMLCLGEKGVIKRIKLLNCGSFMEVFVKNKDIIKTAINSNAWGVVFAHNHLTGVCTPSHEDIKSTKQLAQMLETVGIKLVDHIVFTDDEYRSIVKDRRYLLEKY